jgi:hypothetical protein
MRRQRKKCSKDRNMKGKKMFTAHSLFHHEHCFDDTKLHFSVFAFVQANIKLSS